MKSLRESQIRTIAPVVLLGHTHIKKGFYSVDMGPCVQNREHRRREQCGHWLHLEASSVTAIKKNGVQTRPNSDVNRHHKDENCITNAWHSMTTAFRQISEIEARDPSHPQSFLGQQRLSAALRRVQLCKDKSK
ncbi:hypothetical protein cypCar_00046365 [Cyprinus carpio]|nr:hypothetical protein cypCar_00046365 [Cyprinus carpio]